MSENNIKIHLSTDQKYLQANAVQTVYLMFQAVQPKIPLDTGRLPVNASFVLDRSGSMSGSKLAYTKQAVQFALSHLEEEDTASVVVFDDQVDLLVPAARVINKDQIAQFINRLQTGGSTNLSGGLLEGANQVQLNLCAEQVNRVLLLTDGMANCGVTDPARLTEMAGGLRNKGISVSTLGVGAHFQEDLLVDMAEAGDGNFYFISSPDKIPEIFKEELQGLLSVTGQNPELVLRSENGVEVTAVLGYKPQWGDAVLVKLPDIYNGDTKTVLVELQVKAGSPGMMPLLHIGFRYFDVTASLASVKYDVALSLEVSADAHALADKVDLKVVKEIEIFRAAQVKEEAIREADRGNYERARCILNEQEKILQAVYDATGDDELLEEVQQLKLNMSYMESDNYSAINRKMMKNASYQGRKKR
jgi:Ca-activated chloride channel homolog